MWVHVIIGACRLTEHFSVLWIEQPDSYRAWNSRSAVYMATHLLQPLGQTQTQVWNHTQIFCIYILYIIYTRHCTSTTLYHDKHTKLAPSKHGKCNNQR